MKLIIVEPQCKGNTHVPFNSALLATAIEAFPRDQFSFVAERKHLDLVHNALIIHNKPENSIIWIDLAAIEKDPNNKRTWRTHKHLFSRILTYAQESNSDYIIFSSIDGMGLVLLKYLMFVFPIKFRVVCILHSVMTKLACSPISLKTQIFRKALSLGNKRKNIKFVVLASSIYDYIIDILPELFPYIEQLEHPYLFEKIQSTNKLVLSGHSLKFGFIGSDSIGKGYDLFLQLAQNSTQRCSMYGLENPKFFAIGNTLRKFPKLEFLELQLSSQPLLSDAYNDYVSQMDYLVFPYSKAHYTLTASGAILDSFNSMKPCIVLRTPLFEHYFERMGDIGYMCNNLEEMSDIILDLVSNRPKCLYQVQQQNILNGRSMFEPRNLSPIFREIVKKVHPESYV